jgi:hypothetical protein
VLLSVADPAEFLAALRRLAAPPGEAPRTPPGA